MTPTKEEEAMGHTTRPVIIYLGDMRHPSKVSVDACTAPHDCDVKDCPGGANLVKLRDFETLTTDIEKIYAQLQGFEEKHPGFALPGDRHSATLPKVLALFDELREALEAMMDAYAGWGFAENGRTKAIRLSNAALAKEVTT